MAATRGRDSVIAAEGVAPFQTAVADLSLAIHRERPHAGPAKQSDCIGCAMDRLPGVSALPSVTAMRLALEHLAEAAEAAEANGVRTAPGRALLVIGLTEDKASAFATAAETLGFIVRADDPRRRVVACAGAPICASAHIAARALAPLVAQTAAPSRSATLFRFTFLAAPRVARTHIRRADNRRHARWLRAHR